MTSKLQVTYVGTGLSGRSTSLSSVLRQQGVQVDPLDIRSTDPHTGVPPLQSFDIRLENEVTPVSAWVSWIRSWLWYDSASDSDLDPRITAEIEFLRLSQGFIFVVDSEEDEHKRNIEAFEKLKDDLLFLGRDLNQIPIVVQANKRDASAVIPMQVIRSCFVSQRIRYTESVATRGVGTAEAVHELVRLWRRDL